MSLVNREVEARIVMAVIRACLDKGYKLTVSLENGFDIEEMTGRGVLGITDFDKLMTEAFSGDDFILFIHKADEKPVIEDEDLMNSVGWVKFILGEGPDVINDWCPDNEESNELLKKALDIADHYNDATLTGAWWHDIPQYSKRELDEAVSQASTLTHLSMI